MQRVIAHIDMNSYFASCEQQDNPVWQGLPLGVCEHLGGIIIAASVEAKRWGVKTGTPVWEAKQLCPGIILTKTHPDRYRFYTAKFYRLLEEYTGVVEKYSIDEAFLDLTRVCNVKNNRFGAVDPFDEGRRIVLEIKKRIRQDVGSWLRCSAGVAWNKLVAKIASDLQKPDGLVVVRPEDKPALYARLKLTDIPGIANRQAARLRQYGIRTLLDLRDCPESHLVTWFGVPGRHLWQMGQLEGFLGERFTESPPKSLGHMYTIEKSQRDRLGVGEKVLARLSEFLAKRLRTLQILARGLVVWLEGADGAGVFGRASLGEGVSTGRDIFLAGRDIILTQGGWPKLVVRVSLTAYDLCFGAEQDSLFFQDSKPRRLAMAMDKVNDKYGGPTGWRLAKMTASLGNVPVYAGQDVLLPAPAFFARDIIRDSVGFGRLKEVGNWADDVHVA